MTKKAFTLIELLAVIVIIAIIATIGIYSVTKIMAKSRMNSLSATALAAKRAVNTYAVAGLELSEGETDTIELSDSTSVSYVSSILEPGKDPWGKNYLSIRAEIQKIDNNHVITIYLTTGNGEIYALEPNSDKVVAFSYYTPWSCFVTTGNRKAIIDYNSTCGSIVVIPPGVELIGQSAFYGAGISRITIPTSVKYILGYTFSGNPLLTEVTIPEGVEYIGDKAFKNANNLATINFPSTLEYIAYETFMSTKLSTIDLPDNLEHIEHRVFEDTLVSEGSITFPSNGIYVHPLVYGSLSPLIPPANTTHTSTDGCLAISNFGVLVEYKNTEPGCDGTDLIIPDQIDNIPIKGIAYNVLTQKGLTSIHLPDTIEFIGRGALEYNNLSSIDLPSSLKYLGRFALGENPISNITLPNNISWVAEYALPSGATVNKPASLIFVGGENPISLPND